MSISAASPQQSPLYNRVALGTEPYLFVSYSHEDEDRVLPLIQGLMDRGFRVWFDYQMNPGFEWPAIIAHFLCNCSALLFFVTSHSIDSSNCKDEVFTAKKHRIPILVAHLETVILPQDLELVLVRQHSISLPRFGNDRDKFLDALARSELLTPCLALDAPREQIVSHKPWDAKAWIREGMALCPEGISQTNHPDQVFLCFRNAAALGDPEGQYLLGVCHKQGIGTPKNFALAAQNYLQGAQQGNASAMNNLALLYGNGTGVPRDQAQKEHWLTEAAKLGHAPAQYNLGFHYLHHRKDLPQEEQLALAIPLLKQSADQGDPDAQLLLGQTLYFASPPFRDLEQARVWLKECADRGDQEAAKLLDDPVMPVMRKVLDWMLDWAQRSDQAIDNAEKKSTSYLDRLRQKILPEEDPFATEDSVDP